MKDKVLKKIALIAQSLHGGGIERVTASLADGFIQKGYEAHIILLRDEIKIDLNAKVKLHILSKDGKITKISFLRPFLFSKKLKKICAENKFDLVLSNLADFGGLKIVQLSNIKNLFTIIHNTQSKRRFKRHAKDSILKRYKVRRIQKSFEKLDLTAVSKGVEVDLIHTIKATPKSIRTIYNPFDIKSIRTLSEEKNDRVIKDDFILHVGRFELVHKRQDILLEAYKKANISEKLVILGDGEDRPQIEKLIKDLGLENKVVLPGFDSNPYSWLKRAKLFVFSSDYEGLPTVLIESLIVGTPVVSTNCQSGPSEILVDKLAEFLVPIRDVDALANKIKQALNQYPEIKEEYLQKFDSSYIIDEYIKLAGI